MYASLLTFYLLLSSLYGIKHLWLDAKIVTVACERLCDSFTFESVNMLQIFLKRTNIAARSHCKISF